MGGELSGFRVGSRAAGVFEVPTASANVDDPATLQFPEVLASLDFRVLLHK